MRNDKIVYIAYGVCDHIRIAEVKHLAAEKYQHEPVQVLVTWPTAPSGEATIANGVKRRGGPE
jgi:hypothetical protein